GFAINGEVANDNSGVSVSSAGDVNGDGLADLIVGAFSSDTGATNAGRSYVVYGKSDFATVNLSTIAAGTGGFAINGETASNSSGFSVSSAGDVNGDGLADLIVGAYVYGTSTGRSYVIFGGTEWLTTSVSATGAVTGTGAAEAIVGSSSADTLTGGGGIDRFFAGDGDDVIVLESSDITNLADIATGSPKAAINGGGDIDTIRLSGVASLDLSTIANQGAGGIEENSRIESIEKIDMATDAGVNALIIKVDDVKDMSGMNLFNSVGWTGLAATVAKHQLIVIGGANDTLTIAEGNGQFVLSGGTASDGTNTYNIYDNTALNAQILVLGVGSITNSDILP
ncbi:MAG TPA: hypothetical protein PLV58_07640, partial [Campylobacterales bacterium]|nr:hypothetical protein [Campylobacterales bacterium]